MKNNYLKTSINFIVSNINEIEAFLKMVGWLLDSELFVSQPVYYLASSIFYVMTV